MEKLNSFYSARKIKLLEIIAASSTRKRKQDGSKKLLARTRTFEESK